LQSLPAPTSEPGLVEARQPITLASMANVLPGDTRALVLLGDPFRFLDQLGRPALIKRFPDRYADFVEQTETVVGVDLTSPAGFESVGLEPHGPFGFAIIESEREVMVLLATVRDPERLHHGDHAWADLDAETVGSAVVLEREDDDAMAVLLEGGMAVVLYSQHGDAPRIARQLAKTGRVDRLGVSKSFTQTMQGVEPKGDGIAYANLVGDAHSEALLPEILAIGTAFEIRGSALHADLHVAMSEDHPLTRLVRAAQRSPAAGAPIVRWLDEAPGAVAHLHVDPDVLGQEIVEAAGGFLGLWGGMPNIDPRGEVVPAIDGSIGFAAVPRDPAPPPQDHPEGAPWPKRKLIYTTFVGLREPRLMRALLDRLVGSTLLGGYTLQRAGRDYSTADGDLVMGIRDEVLVIQNNGDEFSKLDPGSTGSFVWPGDGATDPFLLGWDSAQLTAAFGERDLDWPDPESSFLPNDTPEIRQKVAEATALEKERNDLMKQQFAASKRAAAGALEHMGSTWVALGPATDGLAGHLTFAFPGPTFADSVMRIADYWDQEATLAKEYDERMAVLDEQITKAMEEIGELRQQNQP
jgi:hypothetical protein